MVAATSRSELSWFLRGTISIIAANGGRIVREDLTTATDAATLTRKCNELLKRAHEGDSAALPGVRRLLNESPDLWKDLGDIAMQARRVWIELAAGKNDVVAEAPTRELSALTLELSGPCPTILERLLAERVVICSFQLDYFDLMVAPGLAMIDVLKESRSTVH
jgi:hypothetical protein